MRRTAVIIGLIAILDAQASLAHQLEYSWNACLDQGGTSDVTLPCDDPAGSATLYVVFVPSEPIENVVAIDYLIQMTFQGCPGPNFWDNDHLECPRFEFLSGDFAACASAEVVFEDFNRSVGRYPYPGCATNQRGQMVGSIVRTPPTAGTHLLPGHRYVIAAIRIPSAGTVESGGSCTGCPTPVALGMTFFTGHVPERTSIIIYTEGAGRIEVPYEGPCFSANGGSFLCDSPTEALPATWGRLKTIYR